MKCLTVKPIKVPSGYVHPDPPNEALPKHEFTLGLIAPKGAGKTTVICNLLQFYKGYFHTILVYSPTVQSDEKWDLIKEMKLCAENKELKKWIKELEEKKKKQDGLVRRGINNLEIENMSGLNKPHDGLIGEENFFDDYDDEHFKGVMEEQKGLINLLKSHGKPKYLANRILIIFDDLVGSALFSGSRGSYFKGVNTRHRHYSASFIMVSQGYKEIPKTIRTNFTCLIVFEIGNEKELEVIYEEFAMGLKKDDWLEAYQYAIATDYAFLYINFQKEKRLRIMKNFEEYLFVEK